jgi:hypothetical protein
MAKAKSIAALPDLSDLAVFNREALLAARHLARPLNLKEIRLPAGDVGSINIGGPRNGAQINLDPQSWLGAGYDGVRLIGDGRTYLRCTAWDGHTLYVGRHNGAVQLEGVDWYGGWRAAMHFGEQNRTGVTQPNFLFRFYDGRMMVPPPEALGGARGKWGLFGYNYDEHLRDVELDATLALEHARYRHGPALRGSLWERVKTSASGENLKDRADATETAWAGPNAWTIVKACEFERWGEPWGNWTEGAGICLQNSCTHVLVEDSIFRGRLGHSKCIAISSNGMSYDMLTGRIDQGFGNGFVVVRRSAMQGQDNDYSRNEILSIYRDGAGPPMAAMGALIDKCAVYGEKTFVNLKQIPAGRSLVRGCNTPEIRDRARLLEFDTRFESAIPTAHRLVPMSEGYAA